MVSSSSSYAGNENGLVRRVGASLLRDPRSPSSSSVLVDSQKQNASTLASPAAPLPKPRTQESNAFISLPHSAFFSPTCINPLLPAAEKCPIFPSGRYRSPTDSLISPISRGLLIKGRKAVKPSHSLIPPKVLDATYE